MHQQAWYWLSKPEYSVCSIGRVNWYWDSPGVEIKLSPALLPFCEGKPPVTGGFPSLMVLNVESVFMWHHDVWGKENLSRDESVAESLAAVSTCWLVTEQQEIWRLNWLAIDSHLCAYWTGWVGGETQYNGERGNDVLSVARRLLAQLVMSDIVVLVISFPTEYIQWRTKYMSNIITTRKP